MRGITALAAILTMWMAIAPATDHRATASTRVLPIGPPNVVLILTDDQTADELDPMGTVASQLVGRGVTFRNAFVSHSEEGRSSDD